MAACDMIKLLHRYDADLDVCNAKDWTPLSYAKAKGKYGATEEKGIYPEVRHTCHGCTLVKGVDHHKCCGMS